jgi:hypothetical protein
VREVSGRRTRLFGWPFIGRDPSTASGNRPLSLRHRGTLGSPTAGVLYQLLRSRYHRFRLGENCRARCAARCSMSPWIQEDKRTLRTAPSLLNLRSRRKSLHPLQRGPKCHPFYDCPLKKTARLAYYSRPSWNTVGVRQMADHLMCGHQAPDRLVAHRELRNSIDNLLPARSVS